MKKITATKTIRIVIIDTIFKDTELETTKNEEESVNMIIEEKKDTFEWNKKREKS